MKSRNNLLEAWCKKGIAIARPVQKGVTTNKAVIEDTV